MVCAAIAASTTPIPARPTALTVTVLVHTVGWWPAFPHPRMPQNDTSWPTYMSSKGTIAERRKAS